MRFYVINSLYLKLRLYPKVQFPLECNAIRNEQPGRAFISPAYASQPLPGFIKSPEVY
jgi:hypothetical protein